MAYPAQRKAEVSAKLDELGVQYSARESLAVLTARLEEALDLDFDESDESLDSEDYEGFSVEQQDIPEDRANASYQEQIAESECFGVAFFDEDGECPEYGCVFRDQCRQTSLASSSPVQAVEEEPEEADDDGEDIVDTSGVDVSNLRSRMFGGRKRSKERKKKRVVRGPDRKRHVRSMMEVPTDTNGGALYWTFFGVFQPRLDFHLKSEYANVTRIGDDDKKHTRLFRLFPKKRALHIYVNEDFVSCLKACGFDVKMLSAGRRKFFTPHVGYVTIKTQSRLQDVVTEMREFYGVDDG